MRRHLTVAAITSAIVLGALMPAQAQSETEKTTTEIDVRLELSTQDELSDLVSGHLSTDVGPVGNAELSFWFTTDQFGGRTVLIGKALTDATGWARVPMTARRTSYDITVRFDGDHQLAPATGAATATFPDDAIETYHSKEASSSLKGLRATLPRIIGILVASLWAALLYIGFSTVIGIRRHAPELAGTGGARAIEQPSDKSKADPTKGTSPHVGRRNRKKES